MHKSRRYRTLREGQNWAEVGAMPLIDLLREEEVNNVIGAMWNMRWEDMQPTEIGPRGKTVGALKALKSKLFGFFGGWQGCAMAMCHRGQRIANCCRTCCPSMPTVSKGFSPS